MDDSYMKCVMVIASELPIGVIANTCIRAEAYISGSCYLWREEAFYKRLEIGR